MASTRIHKYLINIAFGDANDKIILIDEKVAYPFSKRYKDDLKISTNGISIVAYRSNKVDIDGIFLNYQSALYRQITKALTYYYCTVANHLIIDNIKIEYSSPKNRETKIFTNSDVNQIIGQDADLSLLSNIDRKKLKIIFEESPKGHSYLYALTHLIKSLNIKNKYDSFERKWKAFNAIYKNFSEKESDFECLRALREHMVNNKTKYPLVSNAVDTLDSREIRNNTRWVKFILNDFATSKKTPAFRDFIKRNEDSRLMEIFDDTLTVREQNLKDEGMYDDVKNHIDKNKKKKNNMHLAATLCVKYMYFVRNKSIHAENIDSGFRIIPLNKEEKEVTWLSSILNMLIFDLINGHKNL